MKNMRKRIGFALILAVALLSAFGLTACSGPKVGSGKAYTEKHLKGDYSITYKFTVTATENGKKETESYIHTYERTDEGYHVRYQSGVDAAFAGWMYRKNSSGTYDLYVGNSDSVYTKVQSYDPVSEEVAKNYNLGINYMTFYGDTSGMKANSTQRIAGRVCVRYKQSVNIPFVMKVGYDYAIDKKTGVCMKYAFSVSVKGGGESGDYGVAFICTEFKTKDVTLPSVS